MITKLTSTVPQNIKNVPPAAYLDRCWPFIGKSRVQELLKKRELRVNGEKSDGTTALKGGDTVTLYLDGRYDTSLNVFFDDGNVLALVKPAGLPVDTDADGIGEDTVLSRLHLSHPDARLVHRLDTDTSGVMLAANNEKTEETLVNLFRNHLLVKHYSAEAVGHFSARHADLKAWLVKNAGTATVRVSNAKTAGAYDIETIYTVLGEKNVNGVTVTRLDVEIPTGRTHQIRAHLSHIGHPLMGDDKYGDRAVNKKLKTDKVTLSCRSIAVKDVPEAGAYAGRSFVCPEEG